MRVGRVGKTKPLLLIDLPGCRDQQVSTAHDAVDVLVCVIDHDGQLIGSVAVRPANNEITDIP